MSIRTTWSLGGRMICHCWPSYHFPSLLLPFSRIRKKVGVHSCMCDPTTTASQLHPSKASLWVKMIVAVIGFINSAEGSTVYFLIVKESGRCQNTRLGFSFFLDSAADRKEKWNTPHHCFLWDRASPSMPVPWNWAPPPLERPVAFLSFTMPLPPIWQKYYLHCRWIRFFQTMPHWRKFCLGAGRSLQTWIGTRRQPYCPHAMPALNFSAF